MPAEPTPRFPLIAATVRRGAARLCLSLAWAPLHEVPLPNGRRADILALKPDGYIACLEVKSGPRDFLADSKWSDYLLFCDVFYFAVGTDFPLDLLPGGVGIIVADASGAEIIRDAPSLPLPSARRRGLLHRFATLGAERLAAAEDPVGFASRRAALLVE